MTTGGAIDLGATWFWPNEPQIRSLCHELKCEVFPQATAGNALFEPDSQNVQLLQGNPIESPSYRFALGAQDLAEKLSLTLPADVLRTNTTVTSLQCAEDKVLVGADQGVILADHVIVALPPALAVESIDFGPELPDDLRSLAARTAVWMGSMVKAVATFNEPFWRTTGLSGSAFSYVGPFREIHEHSGKNAKPAALFGFAPSQIFSNKSDESISQAFIVQLNRLFKNEMPSPSEIHIVNWAKQRFTSQEQSLAVATGTFGDSRFQNPLLGRIHWASTETALEFAGHMEGALRAGSSAAKRIMDNMS